VVTSTAHALTTAELDAVAGVLVGAGEEFTGPLTAELITGGRSNLTYLLHADTARWVMRTPPRAGRTPSAHDVAREFRVTAALRDTEVPVARAVALCEDDALFNGPFAIAEFVPGKTVQTRTQLDELDDDTVAALTDELLSTLAALHRVDHVVIGLERFGRPDGYAARQLKRWAAQWELVGPEELRSFAADVVSRLGASVPNQASTGLVHGDFRIDNTILQVAGGASRLEAVVDWELSTIGDPVADVAMMCAYRDPAFDLIVGVPSAWTSPRLPDVTQLAGRYEAAGGVTLAHWDFHMALAYFKIAVIAAGIDHRLRAGAASGAGHATAGESVPRYLTLASEKAEVRR
jgi:aminoglycoside phosphotransferase (APT) family kinase protein